MAKFRVIARMRVEVVVEAEDRGGASRWAHDQLEATQCWQAWGEPCNTEHLVEWITSEPQVTSAVAVDA